MKVQSIKSGRSSGSHHTTQWVTNLTTGHLKIHSISWRAHALFSIFYRSESPTQAFLVSILWLYRKFKPHLDAGVPANDILSMMAKTILAYDNTCHLDGMNVAKLDLPFKYPLNKMWLSIVKVIDRLHIRNHKDKKCKTIYNPEGKVPLEYNSMAAEQTFVWASRLKRIVCAMPQIHQFFYLHRAVKRRNNYTQRCYTNGKVPLLPKQTKEWVEK